MRNVIISVMMLVPAAVGFPRESRANGDVATGKQQFETRCSGCHSIAAGIVKTGPTMFGIDGRKAGTAEKYRYSQAYLDAAQKGLHWDQQMLFDYLFDPVQFLKRFLEADTVRTKMVSTYKDPALRENIIAYLKTLK